MVKVLRTVYPVLQVVGVVLYVTLKPPRKANGTYPTLHWTKQLVKWCVQRARQSSLHWWEKRGDATPFLESCGEYTDTHTHTVCILVWNHSERRMVHSSLCIRVVTCQVVCTTCQAKLFTLEKEVWWCDIPFLRSHEDKQTNAQRDRHTEYAYWYIHVDWRWASKLPICQI